MATPSLRKIKVIIFVNDVINKILLLDLNYIVDVVTLPKFDERSYHNLKFIRIWPKNRIFWGVVLVQVQ